MRSSSEVLWRKEAQTETWGPPILRDWGEDLVQEAEQTSELSGKPRERGALEAKSREILRMYGEL